MARPEPFRTLLEEARVSSEPSSVPVTLTPASKPKSIASAPVASAPVASAPVASAPVASASDARREEKRLEKRLDQAMLAGVTPARGMRAPSLPVPHAPGIPLRLDPLPPPPSPVVLVAPFEATSALLEELEAFTADATRQLERPAAIDAALQDALAAAEATREIPAQRQIVARPVTVTGITPPPMDVDVDVDTAPRRPRAVSTLTANPSNNASNNASNASVTSPIVAVANADDVVEVEPAPPPKLARMPEVVAVVEQQRRRPPPLPRRTPPRGVAAPAPGPSRANVAPKPILVPFDDERGPTRAPTPRATVAPTPVLSAPAPKIVQVLGDELTIPGLSPVSSSSGRVFSQADLYRLQLEFEDTPARPLPALASLLPLPVLAPTFAPESAVAPAVAAPVLVDAMGDADRLGGIESTDLNRLDELEGIEDLDALAQAMGLRSYHEISIPDGEPIDGGVEFENAIGDDDIVDEQPRMTSDVRRARVRAALGDGREDVFLDDEKTIEGLPVIVSRPPLPSRAQKPVVVKIPARPKVSLEARNQARKLYLAAVDELAKGDKIGAIGHLKLAIHYDDGIPLYQDFLKQLTKVDPNITSPRGRRLTASSVRG